MSETWNTNEELPAGGLPRYTVGIDRRRVTEDNGAFGTLRAPRIVWLCPLPFPDDKPLRQRLIDATHIRVQEWARKAKCSIVWIFAGPHATQTMTKPNGMPEIAVNEKRYEIADPHITIRAGTVHHGRRGDSFICQVSGHLYVLLDRDGVPRLDRPILETDRRLVELGDYRVDQMWTWVEGATKNYRDNQLDHLLKDKVDREIFARVRIAYKRPRDDGDYSSYYTIHNHTCKKQFIGDGSVYVRKPATSVYLSNPLLAFLSQKTRKEKEEYEKKARKGKAREINK